MVPRNAAATGEGVARVLSAAVGGRWELRAHGGGGFCASWRARRTDPGAPHAELFVKSAPAAQAPMLQAEADGLHALAAAGCIRVPAVAGCWVDAPLDAALLALEWLELVPAHRPDLGARFGHQLGALHRTPPPEGDGRFGWRRDNWLGATPQRNRWSRDVGLQGWLAFLADERFGAMADRLEAAGREPLLVAAVRRVVDALPGFFDDGHMPRPGLVHGDLWSGNWGCLAGTLPVVYDPAVSVSDAEAELAMMELFGAPPAGFWPAYREVAGIADGYARRRPLYQLYHLLNHALLFGARYARQSMALIEALVGRR